MQAVCFRRRPEGRARRSVVAVLPNGWRRRKSTASGYCVREPQTASRKAPTATSAGVRLCSPSMCTKLKTRVLASSRQMSPSTYRRVPLAALATPIQPRSQGCPFAQPQPKPVGWRRHRAKKMQFATQPCSLPPTQGSRLDHRLRCATQQHPLQLAQHIVAVSAALRPNQTRLLTKRQPILKRT